MQLRRRRVTDRRERVWRLNCIWVFSGFFFFMWREEDNHRTDVRCNEHATLHNYRRPRDESTWQWRRVRTCVDRSWLSFDNTAWDAVARRESIAGIGKTVWERGNRTSVGATCCCTGRTKFSSKTFGLLPLTPSTKNTRNYNFYHSNMDGQSSLIKNLALPLRTIDNPIKQIWRKLEKKLITT